MMCDRQTILTRFEKDKVYRVTIIFTYHHMKHDMLLKYKHTYRNEDFIHVFDVIKNDFTTVRHTIEITDDEIDMIEEIDEEQLVFELI